MQYLASSPRHMPTHTNTQRRGSNPPFLLSLRSQAQRKKAKRRRKKKAKARFAPVRPVIPAIIPDCFTEVGRFLRWLRLGPSRGEYSATRILIKSRGVTAMRYCSFSCVGHCGVTHPDTVEPSAPHHLVHSGSCSDCTAGIPIYRPRSATVPGVCCARRKMPPGVLWLQDEASFHMRDMCEEGVGGGGGGRLMRQMYLHVIKVRFRCMSSHRHQQWQGVCTKPLTCS